ncbi:MAG: PDZ domain-containing protein [Planctomycetes bacterium]|nr:PDZ domain-containing protein [Planctomycetota bacterium]
MNTAQAKLFSWSAAGVLGVGLSLYMVHFAKSQDRTGQTVSTEEMQKKLSSVTDDTEKKDEGPIDYQLVKTGWLDLAWLGRPKENAPPPKVDETPKVAAETKARLENLVKIMAIYYDPASELETRAVIKYTTQSGVDANKVKNGIAGKSVGDRLDGPLAHARIVKIDDAGVEFAFDDEAREHEVLLPGELDLAGRLVYVGEGGQPILPTISALPRSPTYGQWPKKTERIGEDKFRVGLEDAEYIEKNFDRILVDEVRTVAHRDPITKQRDGIQITDIKPGSVVEAHGGKSGDVIKSINGHPVKSEQEAIQFVKAHSDEYDKWEVEVENKGETRTITIYPPNKK